MRKFNVNVNGKSYVVEVEEAGDGVSSSVAAPVSTPALSVAPAPKASVGGTIVKAPMPGLVLKLAVANGSKVKHGDKIIVLEAMKMENDIVASADGMVAFLVKEGDNVAGGADLASIS